MEMHTACQCYSIKSKKENIHSDAQNELKNDENDIIKGNVCALKYQVKKKSNAPWYKAEIHIMCSAFGELQAYVRLASLHLGQRNITWIILPVPSLRQTLQAEIRASIWILYDLEGVARRRKKWAYITSDRKGYWLLKDEGAFYW